jgi:CRP-like cAMP-binding protein
MDALRDVLVGRLNLTEAHDQILKGQMKIKSLSKKQFLIREGNTCNFIAFVLSGSLRSFITTKENQFNNDFYFDGSFATAYTSYLTQQPTNCNIEALTDVEVGLISRETLDGLIKEDVSWLKLTAFISDTYFIRKCKRETSFLKSDAAGRLEQLLAMYPKIQQKVSQYHIASYLGIQPESLSRLKNLKLLDESA